MIPHKLEIIRRLESDKNQRGVVATYNIGSSTVCVQRNGRTTHNCYDPEPVDGGYPNGVLLFPVVQSKYRRSNKNFFVRT
jgi:hypothetical protein